MDPERLYVGIDVCKERMDVHVLPSGQSGSVSYDETGLKELTPSCPKNRMSPKS
ncbi:hypothetical protein ACFLQ0_05780 [Nitrospinota bacterium]